MKTSILNLNQVAAILAAMTIMKSDNCGPTIVHYGTHPEYGHCTLAQFEGGGVLVSAQPYRERTRLVLVQ